jgi:hypothetical protein
MVEVVDLCLRHEFDDFDGVARLRLDIFNFLPLDPHGLVRLDLHGLDNVVQHHRFAAGIHFLMPHPLASRLVDLVEADAGLLPALPPAEGKRTLSLLEH